MYSRTKIFANQEIFIDYGNEYWARVTLEQQRDEERSTTGARHGDAASRVGAMRKQKVTAPEPAEMRGLPWAWDFYADHQRGVQKG